MKQIMYLFFAVWVLTGCSAKDDFDASGYFEADEVMVSAQQSGQLLSYRIKEGDRLKALDSVGQIDVQVIEFQKQQIEASIAALSEKTSVVNDQTELVRRQLEVQKSQLEQQLRERGRTENLVQADAATRK